METAAIETTQPDFTAIKAKQNSAWASGDYSLIGTTLQIVGEELAEAMDVRPGQKILDVAAGNGNFTLAAARRWADITSSDYVPALLERGKERADADRLEVAYETADAEELPFNEASFDAVGSTFGVMFTPNQEKAAADQDQVESVRSKPAEDTPQSPAAPAPSPLSTQQPSSLINIIA